MQTCVISLHLMQTGCCATTNTSNSLSHWRLAAAKQPQQQQAKHASAAAAAALLTTAKHTDKLNNMQHLCEHQQLEETAWQQHDCELTI